MEREFPVWVIVMLPWLGALACSLLAHPGLRLFERRVAMLGHYVGLGAAALALLFTMQATQHLLVSDDPRALGHTPLAELLGAVVIGSVHIELTLIADRLSVSAALLILGLSVLTRMFVPGPSGQRALFAGPIEAAELGRLRTGLAALALLGLLEGAALLVVLAGDLGLAAVGWSMLGLGAVVLVARRADDERRATAAMRMLTRAVLGDLGWIAVCVALVGSGIGLAHNGLWAPLTGEVLYTQLLPGVSWADVIALALLCATLVRLTSAAWVGGSLGEALLDAVLIPATSIYVLLRFTRVLAYAPSVLATCLMLGLLLALLSALVALFRPRDGTPWQGLSGRALGLGAMQLAWVGLVLVALGVGAWRTIALLLLAHALGRLGLRISLLVAGGSKLPKWSSRIARVLCFGVAGLAPSLGFVALAQVVVDAFTRRSLLAPWISWPAAAVVLGVAFALAAASARLWYEELGRKAGDDDEEDGLDLTPTLLSMLALAGLGVFAFAAMFGWVRGPLAWIDKILPLAGGHELVPVGMQERFRDGASIARPWVAGGAAMTALLTGFAWSWARERFRRGHGQELDGVRVSLEWGLSRVAWLIEWIGVLARGLSELAARGIGRGGFEQGPRVIGNLLRDAMTGASPRMRALSLDAMRLSLLGVLLGSGLLLAWLFAKPQVSSPLPSDDYGFGGLRPKLIRAGGAGNERETSEAAPSGAGPSEVVPEGPPMLPHPQRNDGAEPPRSLPRSAGPSRDNPPGPVLVPPEVQR